jgi:hypothetical protein
MARTNYRSDTRKEKAETAAYRSQQCERDRLPGSAMDRMDRMFIDELPADVLAWCKSAGAKEPFWLTLGCY